MREFDPNELIEFGELPIGSLFVFHDLSLTIRTTGIWKKISPRMFQGEARTVAVGPFEIQSIRVSVYRREAKDVL